jgi:hypothetical protein
MPTAAISRSNRMMIRGIIEVESLIFFIAIALK